MLLDGTIKHHPIYYPDMLSLAMEFASEDSTIHDVGSFINTSRFYEVFHAQTQPDMDGTQFGQSKVCAEKSKKFKKN